MQGAKCNVASSKSGVKTRFPETGTGLSLPHSALGPKISGRQTAVSTECGGPKREGTGWGRPSQGELSDSYKGRGL